MKSDREFLDGIYEKAKQYEAVNNKSTFQKRYHSLKPIYMAAILVLMVTSGVVLYQQPWRDKDVMPKTRRDIVITPGSKDAPDKANIPMPTDGVEENNQVDTPATPGTDKVPSMVRGVPFTLPVVEDIIIEGMVTEVFPGEQSVAIQIKQAFAGAVPEKEQIILYVPEVEKISEYFTEKEEVLLYMQQNSEGKWILFQGIDSKYTFTNESNGIRYYENGKDGKVNTSQFSSIE